jgi:hypothetical protein
MFIDNGAAPDVSLTGLIAWLEKQPANKAYAFGDWTVCALAQWMGSIGAGPDVNCGHSYGYIRNGQSFNLRDMAWLVLHGKHTMGALLERAQRKLDGQMTPYEQRLYRKFEAHAVTQAVL